MLAEGAQNVLISMAGDGALLFTEQGTYKTNVLVRPLKNSVGAGDSMIAGFIGLTAVRKIQSKPLNGELLAEAQQLFLMTWQLAN